MFRELHEEVGLKPEQVRIIARTKDWLRYEVPDRFIRRENRGNYRGQKQIWYLLRLIGFDSDLNLRATDHPEFDAWRWSNYWVPLDNVIEFKRDVYQMALNELARHLPAQDSRNRYLRSNVQRGHAHGQHHGQNGKNGLNGLNGANGANGTERPIHTTANPTVPNMPNLPSSMHIETHVLAKTAIFEAPIKDGE
jgi:hypothetical protein